MKYMQKSVRNEIDQEDVTDVNRQKPNKLFISLFIFYSYQLVVDPQAYLASQRSRFESFKLDFLLRIDKPADETEYVCKFRNISWIILLMIYW